VYRLIGLDGKEETVAAGFGPTVAVVSGTFMRKQQIRVITIG